SVGPLDRARLPAGAHRAQAQASARGPETALEAVRPAIAGKAQTEEPGGAISARAGRERSRPRARRSRWCGRRAMRRFVCCLVGLTQLRQNFGKLAAEVLGLTRIVGDAVELFNGGHRPAIAELVAAARRLAKDVLPAAGAIGAYEAALDVHGA